MDMLDISDDLGTYSKSHIPFGDMAPNYFVRGISVIIGIVNFPSRNNYYSLTFSQL